MDKVITWINSYQHGFCSIYTDMYAVVCLSLPPLTNGTISYSDPTLGVGTVAVYKCHPGFALNGPNNTRTCQSDNSWSSGIALCEGLSSDVRFS